MEVFLDLLFVNSEVECRLWRLEQMMRRALDAKDRFDNFRIMNGGGVT